MNASFQNLISAGKPVLIDFFATWCGPCQTLAPILKDVKAELGEHVDIIKIDVDKNPAVASRFQVRGVPTMILFKSGQPVWRQSGVMPKSSIVEAVRKHL